MVAVHQTLVLLLTEEEGEAGVVVEVVVVVGVEIEEIIQIVVAEAEKIITIQLEKLTPTRPRHHQDLAGLEKKTKNRVEEKINNLMEHKMDKLKNNKLQIQRKAPVVFRKKYLEINFHIFLPSSRFLPGTTERVSWTFLKTDVSSAVR